MARIGRRPPGMTVREISIESLGELIDSLTPGEPDPRTGRRRDVGVYHGSSHAHGPLLTTLDRLGGLDPPHTKVHLEGHILRNFARYSRPFLSSEPVNDWERLVLAQHHGVPTRLLDWSYSPLVAAHFAMRRREATGPRVIWRLDWQAVHEAYELPPLALQVEDLPELLAGGRSFTPWDLFQGADHSFACMIEPPSLSARIVAQTAVLTLSSRNDISFDAFLQEEGLGDSLTKFMIPPEAVGRIRDQLELAGMDERRLFPDLDGVATSLRNYYS
jgi:hypothetical protein